MGERGTLVKGRDETRGRKRERERESKSGRERGGGGNMHDRVSECEWEKNIKGIRKMKKEKIKSRVTIERNETIGEKRHEKKKGRRQVQAELTKQKFGKKHEGRTVGRK